MNYAKLCGLKDISDEELIELLKENKGEIEIDKVKIKKAEVTDKGATGYFGETSNLL